MLKREECVAPNVSDTKYHFECTHSLHVMINITLHNGQTTSQQGRQKLQHIWGNWMLIWKSSCPKLERFTLHESLKRFHIVVERLYPIAMKL